VAAEDRGENKIELKNIAYAWQDVHRFSPAPRHRRRIILGILKKIEFNSCLDTGCAQPYLLEAISKRNIQVFGCDISDRVIQANKKNFPAAQFEDVDISKEVYPQGKKFDLVISSEVIEHIKDWQQAIKNLTKMSDRYLLITVPSGKVHNIDKIIGHFRHYGYEELKDEIEKNGFKVIFYKLWGMPFHSVYKYLINAFGYKRIYKNFGTSGYGVIKRIFSYCLYFLFYFNDIFKSGAQLFILAEKDDKDNR
jgi:hypothetical protein